MSLTPLLLKNSKAIITVSNFSRNEISTYYKIGKSKIYVIPNAVGHLFSMSNNCKRNSGEEYYLTVSSVNYHKNLHGLVNALVESNVDIKLKIIGGKTAAFKNVDICSHDPRIIFLGRVTDEELVKLYQGAKAFIFPSFYEGFGIPPLEAQSCGCPVISSDRAAMKEVLDKSVFYFNPEVAVEMINAIKFVNEDKVFRKRLIEKGNENIKRFSWAESARKLNTLIEDFF